MTFDWPAFLRAHGRDWQDKGKRDIYIPCPLCGSADRGAHMGLSLVNGAWGCWRDPAHRGRHPERLIQALLGCSWPQAQALALGGPGAPQAAPAPLEALGRGLAVLAQPSAAESVRGAARVIWDPGLRPLGETRLSKPLLAYLRARGFPGKDAPRAARRYGLRTALAGPFAWRIVFPLEQDGQLVGWTGRATGASKLRYLSYPDGKVLGRVLYLHDQARAGGKLLVLVEGPFDALKVDYYGRAQGTRALALLGSYLSDAKAARVLELARGFEHVGIMLDRDAQGKAEQVRARLASINPALLELPGSISDPGELAGHQVAQLSRLPLAP